MEFLLPDKIRVLLLFSCSVGSDCCDSMDCTVLGSSVHGILQQEYWNGLPFRSPGDLPDPGIKPRSPVLQANSLLSEPPGKFRNNLIDCIHH